MALRVQKSDIKYIESSWEFLDWLTFISETAFSLYLTVSVSCYKKNLYSTCSGIFRAIDSTHTLPLQKTTNVLEHIKRAINVRNILKLITCVNLMREFHEYHHQKVATLKNWKCITYPGLFKVFLLITYLNIC